MTATAPLAGSKKRRQKSHEPDYRRVYVAKVRAREELHGKFHRKAIGSLLERLALRSQTEVAQMLGVSKEAVRQTENRALDKVRRAFLALGIVPDGHSCPRPQRLHAH